MDNNTKRLTPIPMPTQCVFIEKNGMSNPPNHTIPYNENSTRALSKKNRVYVLRDFLLRNYSSSLTSPSCTVLDVAGGRGDLSWILRNIDGIDSIIADPRIPNHRRLVKSVDFLLNHPEEAKIRAMEGLPTHQPLAKLLPRLIANHGSNTMPGVSTGTSVTDYVSVASPNFVRIHVDDTLIETLRTVLANNDLSAWDEYWDKEQCRIESNTIYYGGTEPKTARGDSDGTEKYGRITNSRVALEMFRSLHLIVGFHPDQATEASVDLALLLKIPFIVVPCCVFPSEFPDRTLNGKRVWRHSEFVEYLCLKHNKIRKDELPFVETETAKNVVLYMLDEDMD